MTEPKKSDHWELLANNLGAKPLAGEPEGAPQAPAEPPRPAASVKPAKPKTRPSAAPHPTGDWDSLVNELGVAAKIEPTEKPSQETTPSRGPAAAQPRRAAATRPSATRPSADAAAGLTVQRSGARQENSADMVESFAAELPEIVDEHFSLIEEPYEAKSPAFGGIEEPFRLRKEEPVEERADSEETEGETQKAKSGRRRRKRRRRTSAPAEKTAAEEPAQDESAPSDELTVVYNVSEEVAEPVPGVAGAEQPEPSAERTKRRRKRRGSSRKKHRRGDDEVAAVVERPTIEPADEPDVELDEEVDDDDEQAAEAIEPDDEFDDEESADDSEIAKTIHRGIPTWEETIDLIVSKNMETRAKKGSGANRGWNSSGSKPRTASADQPSHRGRGGRGKSSKKRS